MDDAAQDAGTALLERALGYALCSVRPVTPQALNRPTPCARWDLRALLWHTNDSLAALYEGVEHGHVCPERAAPDGDRRPEGDRRPGGDPRPGGGDDPAAVFRARATRLLGAWAASDGPADRFVVIDDLPLTAAALVRTGALEIAVHGWDIAQATGLPRPVPAALATALMRTARHLVPSPAARGPLFGPPLTVCAEADPSDRLVAFLGRDPYGSWRGRERGRAGGGTEERSR
ncbi:TIGR03086 family metal-binding protein [Streptomyces winkii]|uniref:TIGR03086 family metal-binding protein n=1 Tax=Streptomyces winkii TaxID=3051178 RepID=UPI0028D6EA2C|nr:TIGR03086 family metal-binding protein [Streptomyces sp. DSM 40971]